jgi:hypothetical protein
MRKMRANSAAACLGSVVAISSLGISSAQAEVSVTRGVASGSAYLLISGQLVGPLRTAEGGNVTGPVVVEPAGSDHVQKKHIGGIKYEDLVLKASTGMSKVFYEDIRSAVAPSSTAQRLDGAVINLDSISRKETSRRTFTGGSISEVTFPGLDASSKEPASLTVKIVPETTRVVQSTAGVQLTKPDVQKAWFTSNFRLKIKGLEGACQKVSTIEPINIKVRRPANSAGGARDAAPSATVIYSDLVVTIAEADSAAFINWHDSFVVKGVNGDDQEKDATLEYLAPNNEVLFTLTLGHVGIYRITPVPGDANSTIRRLKVEMYVESMTFNYVAAWA